MTRTIMTAAELDALPDERVLLEASGRYRYQRGAFEQCWVRLVPSSITGTTDRVWEVLVHGSEIPHSLVHTEDLDLPVTVLHDPSAPVPVVSDAAVEAAARALRIEEVGDSAPPGFAARQWDIGETPREKPTRLARAALSTALPHLGAAPSATRDEVRDEIAGHPIGSGYYATSVGVDEAAEVADALLARFTITPRTDR